RCGYGVLGESACPTITACWGGVNGYGFGKLSQRLIVGAKLLVTSDIHSSFAAPIELWYTPGDFLLGIS
ncbi:hypothetical protein, partial [Candidatus Oscillochloris fontis]|uniref:hypothetical protein n=1 Tax=Candidatus Oscillochloris fontis TaxID=2496868 RepID=UPI001EE87D7D